MQLCHRVLIVSTLLGLASVAIGADPKLEISGIFSDHMVVQRDLPLKIWGKAKAGGLVTVNFAETKAEGKAGDEGDWEIKLPPFSAGGPYELIVATDDETTSIRDILVGEVWVCSGQSNMEFALERASNGVEAVAGATNRNIRLFTVRQNRAVKPIKEFSAPSSWEVCSPESAAQFSAVGYFFGRDLQKELKVPIGLIDSSWGGTKAEWWTPLEGLKQLPYLADDAKMMENAAPDSKLTSDYTKATYGWKKGMMSKDPGNGRNKKPWTESEFDDSSWKTTVLPVMLEDMGMDKFDGSIWYRRTFEVTEDQVNKVAVLSLCANDDDNAYINGTRVGYTTTPSKARHYTLPTNLVKPGTNTIAIQVWDWGKEGGICGTSESLNISFNDGKTTQTSPLAGEWKYCVGLPLTENSNRPKAPQIIRPTVLYNAMISPMLNFGIRGVIWYQGEANAHAFTAEKYDQTLAMMISQWRKNWGIGDFPFLQVQLASFMKIEPEPGESDWAVLRESQENVLNLSKNTSFASAIDVGEENDIHPKNKETVGQRLALNALALAYGQKIEYMGPVYKEHKIEDTKIRVAFTHADQLITSNGETLKGFAIAGSDKRFVWADAKIDGNTVVVSSNEVKAPVAARYGWANYVTGNLYNAAGLPASPFRTDSPKRPQ